MLRVNDVQKVDYDRKRIRKEIYQKIYEQFCRKIKLSTEMGYKCTILTVPSTVFGYPTFDRQVAAHYLCRQFHNGGFETRIVDTYSMYVAWNIQKRSKKYKPPEKENTEQDDDEYEMPTLMNLKKAAAKYKR
jgi:hypothetical protein